MKRVSPKIITDSTIIYARLNGYCYHLNRHCVMLRDGAFERYGYRQITQEDVKSQGLNPCVCAYDESVNRSVLHSE